MTEILAFIAFVIAAIVSVSRHARWWPVFACAGLALLAWPFH